MNTAIFIVRHLEFEAKPEVPSKQGTDRYDQAS
jgi:hypothetical protein